MFDHVLLVLLLLADVLCWYEARRSGSIMQVYFRERAAWYERRYRLQNAKTAESSSIPPSTSVKVGGRRSSSIVEIVNPNERQIGRRETEPAIEKPKKDFASTCETESSQLTATNAPVAEKHEKSS